MKNKILINKWLLNKILINKWLIIIIILFICIIPFILNFKEGLVSDPIIIPNPNRGVFNRGPATIPLSSNVPEAQINKNIKELDTNLTKKVSDIKFNDNINRSTLTWWIDKVWTKLNGLEAYIKTYNGQNPSNKDDIQHIKNNVNDLKQYNEEHLHLKESTEQIQSDIKEMNKSIKNDSDDLKQKMKKLIDNEELKNNDSLNAKLDKYNTQSVELIGTLIGKIDVNKQDLDKIKEKIRVPLEK
jgi:methyl-accepting chemotaxis protein